MAMSPRTPAIRLDLNHSSRSRPIFTKVIVGVDGYEGGHDAVALAAALAPAGALTLLNAYPYEPHPSPGALEAYGRLLRQEALETLERTRRDVGVDAGMQAVAEVSPAKALHRAAQDQRADLLVVGSCHREIGRASCRERV